MFKTFADAHTAWLAAGKDLNAARRDYSERLAHKAGDRATRADLRARVRACALQERSARYLMKYMLRTAAPEVPAKKGLAA